MTTKQTQRLLEKKRVSRAKLSAEISSLEAQLRPQCDHSKTEDYTWEWDSGYGRQEMLKGKRCLFCWAVDNWNNGRFF